MSNMNRVSYDLMLLPTVCDGSSLVVHVVVVSTSKIVPISAQYFVLQYSVSDADVVRGHG